MKTRHVIAIDGLAGSGKTTLSKMLAVKLGYAHLNSGILYRAVGYLALKEGVDRASADDLSALIKGHDLKLELDEDRASRMLIDGEDLGDALYQPEVSESTSLISAVPEVRTLLVDAQRNAFSGHHLVAEGRDMGTVIFPDAALKIFVTVDVETRVSRRINQLYGDPENLSVERLKEIQLEMRREIIERDERDANRAVAPAKAAADAIEIDNSGRSLTDVIQNMYDCAANKGLV